MGILQKTEKTQENEVVKLNAVPFGSRLAAKEPLWTATQNVTEDHMSVAFNFISLPKPIWPPTLNVTEDHKSVAFNFISLPCSMGKSQSLTNHFSLFIKRNH